MDFQGFSLNFIDFPLFFNGKQRFRQNNFLVFSKFFLVFSKFFSNFRTRADPSYKVLKDLLTKSHTPVNHKGSADVEAPGFKSICIDAPLFFNEK